MTYTYMYLHNNVSELLNKKKILRILARKY